MKITGLAVSTLGAEKLVNITALFEANEALDPNDISRLLDITREAAGADKAPQAQGSSAEETVNPTGRRSRRSPGAEPASASESAPAADTAAPGRRRRSSAASPEPTPEAEAPLGRRRRSSTAAGTAEPSEATPASGGEAVSAETAPLGRRRRGAAPAEAVAASPATAQAHADGRRRRSSGSANTADTTSKNVTAKSPSSISDADLSKAASECARICTPVVVKDILKSFHVEKVGDIKAAERQEFLDECQGAIKEAEGE